MPGRTGSNKPAGFNTAGALRNSSPSELTYHDGSSGAPRPYRALRSNPRGRTAEHRNAKRRRGGVRPLHGRDLHLPPQQDLPAVRHQSPPPGGEGVMNQTVAAVTFGRPSSTT